jgi:ATP/maltotriose-dependent transcriptional regulator MalT/DNA-binding SARP family transcriptional activator
LLPALRLRITLMAKNSAGEQQEDKGRSRPEAGSSIGAARLAKITAPRLRNVLQRDRLFRMLDGLRDQSLLWLSAPAGAGKTTLIASWAAAVKPTLVWFQCDEGDGDLAAFFHFLSLALVNVDGAQAESMPRLTPDMYAALTIFVRNYCREMFAQLKVPALVVFDNWQEVPAGSPLRELLPVMIEEVPHGVTLAILSREGPDSRFSRALSTGRMTVLGWSELQLTEAETNDLVAQYEPTPDQHAVPSAHDIYAMTHGWVAGAAVLLRRELPVNPPNWSERNASNQGVFDYLASEVFDRLEPAIQDFALRTACLKSISVDVARDSTGNESAQQLLEGLVNRNVFTLQRPGSATYEYHPLLREFLKNRFVARSGMPAWRQHEQQTAEVLVRHGQLEAAISLLLEAAAWTDAAMLIVNIAPLLAQQGRFKTLIDWITAVPEQERQSLPWLTYWLGASQLVSGIATARTTLEAAYAQFVDQKDVLGQMLCAVDIAQFFQFILADIGPMVLWVNRLSSLLDKKPTFPSAELEARICAGYVAGLSLVEPGTVAIGDYADKLLTLMNTVKDVNSRAYAASNVLMQLTSSGDTIRFMQWRPIVDALLARRDVAPALQLQLKWACAHMVLQTGDFVLTHTLLADITELATSINNPVAHIRATLARLQTTNIALHQQAVDRELILLAPVAATAGLYVRSHFAYVEALALASGQRYVDALESARQAYELAVQLGMKFCEMLALLLQAEVHCELNQFDEASQCLNEAASLQTHARSPQFEFNFWLVTAELARRRGDIDACDTHLRKALAIGRLYQYAAFFHRCTRLFMHLIPVALERGIETEYCLQLIGKLDLKPSSPDIEQWPWPIKIYSLGRFEVIVDGERLESGGRTQHKPLDLLKALLTNPTGLNSAALLEHLWPDLDGDAARNALDLALHRLRRLLKHKEAVVTQHGRPYLNRDYVWVDAWALQTLCAQDSGSLEGEALLRHTKAVLDLYRGPFLAEDESPWAFALRDRLRTQCRRHFSAVVKRLETGGRREDLPDLLNRAIEVDPVNEEFHLQLMQCHRAQGRYVEGAAAYRRCCELLKRLSGTEPSATTHALGRELSNEALHSA